MSEIVGVLLAGGLSSRMGGGDKGLRMLGARTILERVVARVRPQVGHLLLNANGDAGRFAAFPFLDGLPVVPDGVPGFAGPLAGVLAAMDWAASHATGAADVVSVPTDTPFLPHDLAVRLIAARDAAGARLASVRSGGPECGWRVHPVVGLWPVALRHDLRHALVSEGLRKIDRWTARHPRALADFGTDPVDPFFNANTPEDLSEAERLLAAHPDLQGSSSAMGM